MKIKLAKSKRAERHSFSFFINKSSLSFYFPDFHFTRARVGAFFPTTIVWRRDTTFYYTWAFAFIILGFGFGFAPVHAESPFLTEEDKKLFF